MSQIIYKDIFKNYPLLNKRFKNQNYIEYRLEDFLVLKDTYKVADEDAWQLETHKVNVSNLVENILKFNKNYALVTYNIDVIGYTDSYGDFDKESYEIYLNGWVSLSPEEEAELKEADLANVRKRFIW